MENILQNKKEKKRHFNSNTNHRTSITHFNSTICDCSLSDNITATPNGN